MTPFTIEDATEICEDFEDLIDTEFTIGSPVVYLVHDVVISPFHEADKQAFIQSYIEGNDKERLLSLYEGQDYDVLLFVSDADDEASLEHMTIRAFAAQQGIGYSFP